ncbi:hypothetical protein ACN27G_27570 [Plantactinospora sp. WMMB334]|uniref:hypothetical protein n=1 Tax=Plantactinospora sp. WMMB334 TaxID=3404119 RepID=UPI003B92AB9C
MADPHIYRPMQPDRLRLGMPYHRNNRSWLKSVLGDRIQPTWVKNPGYWTLARSHFTPLVDALLERFGVVFASVEFSTTQKCDTRCREALGDDCECSCLGERHGGGLWGDGWVQVGETTLLHSDRQVRHMRLTR